MQKLVCLAATAIILITPCSFSHARTKVYRCELDNGQLGFQQFPCGDKGTAVELKIRKSGWSALRDGEKSMLDGYEKRESSSRRRRDREVKTPVIDASTCQNRRKQLDAIRLKLRRGYKLLESDGLHRKRDKHADFLRQYCS